MPTTNEPRFPDVTVQLTGQDGNAFLIIGRVRRALADAGHRAEADEFAQLAVASQSYDALLQLTMSWVDVA